MQRGRTIPGSAAESERVEPRAYFKQIWPPVEVPHSAFGDVGATGLEQALTTRAAAVRTMRAILLRRIELPRESVWAANFLPGS